jgi:hypothetical protein
MEGSPLTLRRHSQTGDARRTGGGAGANLRGNEEARIDGGIAQAPP